MKLSNYLGFNSAMLPMLMYEGFKPSVGNLKILQTVEDQSFKETIHLEGGTSFLHYSTAFLWDSLKSDDYLRQSLVPAGLEDESSVAGFVIMAVKADLPSFVTLIDGVEGKRSIFGRLMLSTFSSCQDVQYDFLVNPKCVFEHSSDALRALEQIKAIESALFWGKAKGYKIVSVSSELLAHSKDAWRDAH